MMNEWGYGYIQSASRWQGLIHWINWIANYGPAKGDTRRHEKEKREAMESEEEVITVANILDVLSDPFSLSQLLKNHSGFLPLFKQTMLKLSPPESVDDWNGHSTTRTMINRQSSHRTGSDTTFIKKKERESSSHWLLESDTMITPYIVDDDIDIEERRRTTRMSIPKEFRSMKDHQAFLLKPLLSFIQSEVPNSRVRKRRKVFSLPLTSTTPQQPRNMAVIYCLFTPADRTAC